MLQLVRDSNFVHGKDQSIQRLPMLEEWLSQMTDCIPGECIPNEMRAEKK